MRATDEESVPRKMTRFDTHDESDVTELVDLVVANRRGAVSPEAMQRVHEDLAALLLQLGHPAWRAGIERALNAAMRKELRGNIAGFVADAARRWLAERADVGLSSRGGMDPHALLPKPDPLPDPATTRATRDDIRRRLAFLRPRPPTESADASRDQGR